MTTPFRPTPERNPTASGPTGASPWPIVAPRRSGRHLVGAVVCTHPLPHPAEALRVGHRFAYHAERPILLRPSRRRFAVQRDGVGAEVADLEVEDLIDDVVVET